MVRLGELRPYGQDLECESRMSGASRGTRCPAVSPLPSRPKIRKCLLPSVLHFPSPGLSSFAQIIVTTPFGCHCLGQCEQREFSPKRLTSQQRKRLRQDNDLLTKRKLRKSFLAGHRFGLESALDLQRHWVGQGHHSHTAGGSGTQLPLFVQSWLAPVVQRLLPYYGDVASSPLAPG
jgi:hypothetical protein